MMTSQLTIPVDQLIQPVMTAIVTIAGMWILQKFKSIEMKLQLDAQTAQLAFKTEQTAKALALKTDRVAEGLGTKVDGVHDMLNSDLAKWKAELTAQFDARMEQQIKLTEAAIKAAHAESFAAGQEDMRQKLVVPASEPPKPSIPTEVQP